MALSVGCSPTQSLPLSHTFKLFHLACNLLFGARTFHGHFASIFFFLYIYMERND